MSGAGGDQTWRGRESSWGTFTPRPRLAETGLDTWFLAGNRQGVRIHRPPSLQARRLRTQRFRTSVLSASASFGNCRAPRTAGRLAE